MCLKMQECDVVRSRLPRFVSVLFVLIASLSAGAQAQLRLDATERRLRPTLRLVTAPNDSIILTLGSDSAFVAVSGRLTVPVILDVNKAPGRNVSEFAGDIQWDPTRLRLDSAVSAQFAPASVDITNAASGVAGIALTSPAGSAKQVTLATLYFTALNVTGPATVTPRAILAFDQREEDLLPSFTNRPLHVCVSDGPTLFGDTNDDGQVNIVDAQQVGRYGIGLSVPRLQILQYNGDVNNDTRIDIIDAQQIARFSIGLNAAARIATRPPSPCAAP
jgi:hypothetical protein